MVGRTGFASTGASPLGWLYRVQVRDTITARFREEYTEFAVPAKLPSMIVGALPAGPDAVQGMMAVVTDSNTAVWGATVASGGSNVVMVWYNGTVWKVH